MTTFIVDWSELEEAAGEQAVEELGNGRWRDVAIGLAKQGAEPDDVYRQYLRRFPTRQGSATLLMLAVRHLRQTAVASKGA